MFDRMDGRPERLELCRPLGERARGQPRPKTQGLHRLCTNWREALAMAEQEGCCISDAADAIKRIKKDASTEFAFALALSVVKMPFALRCVEHEYRGARFVFRDNSERVTDRC